MFFVCTQTSRTYYYHDDLQLVLRPIRHLAKRRTPRRRRTGKLGLHKDLFNTRVAFVKGCVECGKVVDVYTMGDHANIERETARVSEGRRDRRKGEEERTK